MHTGRQRGKHTKLSLDKFSLDVSSQQKIQYSIILVTTVKLLVICPYKLLHLVRGVLSASSLHGGKKELLIIVRHFVGQQTGDIIVLSCGV